MSRINLWTLMLVTTLSLGAVAQQTLPELQPQQIASQELKAGSPAGDLMLKGKNIEMAMADLRGLGAEPEPMEPVPFGAHCYCKAIVYVGDNAGGSISNPIIDFGQLDSWGTQIGHNKQCADECSAASARDPHFN